MQISINRIKNEDEQKTAWAIRHEVFVIGQNCPEELEWEHEEESIHYLALLDGEPVGTARWRETEKGIKLERFAVLAVARNKGIGSALVQALTQELNAAGKLLYLHAQLEAAPLYAKFGFKPKGDNFWEAGIEHVKMEKA
ncbi:MAG: GNAT family N-acetyltransferase [Bacteroidetes bacterium]|nr:GNAT family N-acetyltransferase [Bacteroidota bacterium]